MEGDAGRCGDSTDVLRRDSAPFQHGRVVSSDRCRQFSDTAGAADDLAHLHARKCGSDPRFVSSEIVGRPHPPFSTAAHNRRVDAWKQIGERIREARRRAGLTQVDLAAAIDISRSHLAHVENGRDRISLDKLSKLAQETRVLLPWLLGEPMGLRNQDTDAARAEWGAAYDSLDADTRKAILVIARSGSRAHLNPPPTASKGACVVPIRPRRARKK
jgi:transcriptional regulator with XRE-family HTH domain